MFADHDECLFRKFHVILFELKGFQLTREKQTGPDETAILV